MSFARPLPFSVPFSDAENDEEALKVINPEILPKLQQISVRVADAQDEEAFTQGTHKYYVSEKRLLTSLSAVKPVFHFRLGCLENTQPWSYRPGDSFDIYCKNSPVIVKELLERIRVDGSRIVRVEGSGKAFDGIRTSISRLFTEFIDISQYPKKSFLRHLAEFCSSEYERRSLLFLSSRLGSSEYLRLVDQYGCLLDFLATFPSCQPSLGCLLTHLPQLAPRSYSVMSLPSEEIEFIASVSSFTTPGPNPRTRFGIGSSFLADSLSIGSYVSLTPRLPTLFHLPEDSSVPIVFVCAGVAVSPFIGFLRQRSAINDHQLGFCWLLYGFRRRDQDFLFREELEKHLVNGAMSKLSVSTSREPPNRYVQETLYEERAQFYECCTSHPNTKIYLCGDEMGMIKGVNDTIQKIFEERLGAEAAKRMIKEWSECGRILRDIWV